MRILITTVLTLLLFARVTFADESSKTVERFVQAYNDRDIEAMLELSSTEMHWMSVSGQQISIETSTHSELSERPCLTTLIPVQMPAPKSVQ